MTPPPDTPFSFIWPAMLAGLLLAPVLAAVYAVLQRRRRRLAARYAGFGLAPAAARRGPGAGRHIPPILFLASLAILAVALARPQTSVSLPRVEGTAILVFDVSGSMAADDLKPTRMEAAKSAARAFVDRQPAGVQIGVVAFSDSGLSVQAPTDDAGMIYAAIARLRPQRGTSLAYGISAALNAIETARQPTRYYSNPRATPTPTPTPVPAGVHAPAVIILLTDGENNIPPDPLVAAKAAADRGVRIYTIGIGSPAGATLHIDGFTVHTQLDEAALKDIANLTGGTYSNAADEQQLRAVYENLHPQLVVRPEKTEVTALFAGASIAVFLLGSALSLAWLGRLV